MFMSKLYNVAVYNFKINSQRILKQCYRDDTRAIGFRRNNIETILGGRNVVHLTSTAKFFWELF